MKWFLRFLLSMFLSFICMLGALGAKYPLSVLLIYLGKGIWIIFFITYFWNRADRIKKKNFDEYMRRRNRNGGK